MAELDRFYEKMANQLILPSQLDAFSDHNYLDQLCSLNFHSKTTYPRRVSIVCTFGQSCKDVPIIEKMIEAGMDLARLNCSYYDHQSLLETVQNIRTAVNNLNMRTGTAYTVAIALETRGPEIRTGLLEGGVDVLLKKGEIIKLTTDKAYLEKGNASTVYINYDNILKVIQPDMMIYLDNGYISLMVTGIQGSNLICNVEKGGMMGSRRNCFLPGVHIDLPAISEKDAQDIEFAITHDLDFVIASGIRDGSEIAGLRKQFGHRLGCMKIIAKIENQYGYRNIDEIIKEADGILIYRSTLGVELPMEKVFLAEKSIITKCNVNGKSVISGKELLLSMIKNARPTRAECVDVANVVIDGVDAIMLSDETTRGNYPVECVKYLDGIAKEAEAAIWKGHLVDEFYEMNPIPMDGTESLSAAAVQASIRCMAAAIVALSLTGLTAATISKYNPRCPVIVVGNDKCKMRQSLIHKAVWPLVYDGKDIAEPTDMSWGERLKHRTDYGIAYGKAMGFIRSGDPVVIMYGSKPIPGHTDTLSIQYVTDIVTPLYY